LSQDHGFGEQQGCSVGATLLGVHSVRDAVRSCVLLGSLLGYCQAVDAEIVANAADDEKGPSSVNHSGENEVEAEVPKLECCGHRPESRSRDGEIWVVDQERTSDHGNKHDGPVGKWLVSQMRQDDLGRHAPEDQRHSQAVQNEVVVFQQMRVWRSEPSHCARDKNDQRRPLVDQWQQGQVLSAAHACDIDDTCRKMCHEKGEQDNGYPELLQCDLADLCLVGREVVCEWCRPNLRAEVSRRADEEAR
jgi:hypothetical protein